MPQFRLAQAADLLGVSRDTVRRRVDDGLLPGVQDDTQHVVVVDGAALAAYMQDRRTLPDDPVPVASSARNRMVGIVVAVVSGPVMSQVEMQCGRHRVVSLLSTEAVEDLGLEPGKLAVAVVKSTDITVEVSPIRERPASF
ncbi:molybdenum-pterin binding protein [Pseudonocardia dioxanivorans CB1190]|uniref:Molybdenum-pterin binding protein n=1 Tax=Pseudonocardia dioxanivorans (strain ATCC 55486 / DSM 44775 / JCM 13855 / CB1190) TaxID=675635 RepID=F4CXC8_PSEUX|nr:TOBE domain-containing protein [Pseudonocardia dioxanivorans]AEA26502.1 molybdenum-pterin binding protein [Pseudonocardia dioxanivorans CB1190]